MKNKRIISFIFACIICVMSVYFSYPVTVYARNQFNWSTMDRDKWGPGKSYNECSDEEKSYRNTQIFAMYANEIAKGSLYLLNLVYPGVGDLASGAFGGFESMIISHSAISNGATTYTEYLLREAGLGYLLDKDYGDDMPDPNNLDMTFSPDFLNELQAYVNQVNEDSSDFVNLPVYNYSDGDFIYQSYGGELDNARKGFITNAINFAYSKLKYNHICWIDSHYFNYDKDNSIHGNSVGGNYSCFFWTEDSSSDFVYYLNSDITSSADSSLKRASFCIKRKDGQPFKYYYTIFCMYDYCGEPVRICEETKSIVNVNSSCSFNGPINGRVWKYPYSGLVTGQSKFGFYRSAGHVSSVLTYGPSLPTFIQSSDAASTVYDNSQTINSHDVITYDYSTVINNINPEPGMNADELQKRIDEVLTEMGAISGNTEDIKQNTELQVSWLRKIYDKLCDVYDKIGGGLSTGQFLEWEWLQVKLDAIIALLGIQTAADLWDDVTDEVAVLGDIGTDIGEALTMKFPFCLPWDMMLILNTLKSVPETPVFEIPFKIPSWNVDTTFTLDLSDFQTLSNISKWFFDILYGFAITKLTLKILQVQIVGTSG